METPIQPIFTTTYDHIGIFNVRTLPDGTRLEGKEFEEWQAKAREALLEQLKNPTQSIVTYTFDKAGGMIGIIKSDGADVQGEDRDPPAHKPDDDNRMDG